MIVLDTNVVSELTRRRPDRAVLAWVDGHDAHAIGTTSVTAAELRVGVALLPAGKRRTAIGQAVDRMLAQFPPRRLLVFDAVAATHYADIVATRSRAGRPIDALDAQIAAICRLRESTLATRNVRDFEDTGVTVVNPWTD